jgi:hypothetical protein
VRIRIKGGDLADQTREPIANIGHCCGFDFEKAVIIGVFKGERQKQPVRKA